MGMIRDRLLRRREFLLGGAFLVTRRWRLEPAAADLLWKVALLAGLVTGTIQSRLALSTPAAVTCVLSALMRPPVASEPLPGATKRRVLAGFSCTGATGLEPATSAVTGQRSNQLSYAPRVVRGR